MKWQRLILWASGAVVSTGLQAQDPRLAQQAFHCAGVMAALAQAAATEPQAAQRWRRASNLLLDVVPPSQGGSGDMVSLQTKAMQAAQQKQMEQSLAYQEDVVLCGAWSEGFLGQGEQVRFVPVYPKIVSPAVRAQYETAARQWLLAPGR